MKNIKRWWERVKFEADWLENVADYSRISSYWMAVGDNTINPYICRVMGHKWFRCNSPLAGYIERFCDRCGLMQIKPFFGRWKSISFHDAIKKQKEKTYWRL